MRFETILATRALDYAQHSDIDFRRWCRAVRPYRKGSRVQNQKRVWIEAGELNMVVRRNMRCKHDKKIISTVCGNRTRWHHADDGVECDPDQEMTFEHVESILPALRERLLREMPCSKRVQ